MDLKQAGSSLDALVSSFHTRIVELQELVIARNSSPFPTSSSLFPLVPDDSGLDILHEPCHLKEEPVAIPKGKKCTSPAPRWYISAEELDSLSSCSEKKLNDIPGSLIISIYNLIWILKDILAEDTWEKALVSRLMLPNGLIPVTVTHRSFAISAVFLKLASVITVCLPSQNLIDDFIIHG
ncbi:hypothetical protein BHE74_00002336 [Ensete ventricosum]|nr:hypothetical protein BHE74_00002336 [Ensete ventricosum]